METHKAIKLKFSIHPRNFMEPRSLYVSKYVCKIQMINKHNLMGEIDIELSYQDLWNLEILNRRKRFG